VRVEPSFHKPGPAQIAVRIEEQPYQPRIERAEYLPPSRYARSPVLMNDVYEIGMVSGFVDEMVADRIADSAHDTWITRDAAQDGGYQCLRDRDEAIRRSSANSVGRRLSNSSNPRKNGGCDVSGGNSENPGSRLMSSTAT